MHHSFVSSASHVQSQSTLGAARSVLRSLVLALCVTILTAILLGALLPQQAQAQENDEYVSQVGGNDIEATQRLISIGLAMWQGGQSSLKVEEIFHSAYAQAGSVEAKVLAADMLTDLYLTTDESVKAIRLFDTMLSSPDVRQDTICLAHCYDGMGRAYHAGKQYVKAIKCYRQAEELLRNQVDSTAQAQLFVDMAKTLMTAGDVQEARQLASRAQKMTNPDDLVLLFEVLSTQARIEAILYNHVKAYDLMEDALTLSRTMWSKEVNDIRNTTNPLMVQQQDDIKRKFQKEKEALKALCLESRNSRNLALTMAVIIGLVGVISLLGFVITLVRLRINTIRLADMERKCRDSLKVMNIVAHDSTNQFNALLGFAGMLVEKTKNGDPEDAEFARHVYDAASRLYQMMSNAMTWSCSQNQLESHKQVVPISKCIDTVISVAELMAMEKGVTIHNNVPEEVKVMADPSHFEIIMRNLITNAIKFSGHMGIINISALEHNGKVDVTIEDNGVGMSIDAVRRFNSEKQISSTEGTDNERGTGLGLSICRSLARTNGGDIAIESTLGKGTLVTLRLLSK